jgi:hypothetical protein
MKQGFLPFSYRTTGTFFALRDVSLNSNTAYFFEIGWNERPI